MNKTVEQAREIITEVVFPNDSYPVLYKSYWSDYINDAYKLQYNQDGIYTDVMLDIFRTYYNVELDFSTFDAIVWNNERTPYPIIYIIRYKGADGKELYLWEYYDNFQQLVQLNNPKNA